MQRLTPLAQSMIGVIGAGALFAAVRTYGPNRNNNEDDALVVEPFGELTKARRDEVIAEGERMLTTMHAGEGHDIRFGTVARP